MNGIVSLCCRWRPEDLGGAAIGINNRGDVVGYDHTSNNRLVGWLWSNGGYSSLPVCGTNTAALGINSSGIIIGNRRFRLMRRLLTGQLGRTGERGFILCGGTTQHLAGFVYAINDFGEAVGGSASEGKVMATIYKNGIATVIPDLRGFAVGINSSACVVGSFQPARDSGRHLFKWSANSGAFDMTPEGYLSAEAAAINRPWPTSWVFGETMGGKFPVLFAHAGPRGRRTHAEGTVTTEPPSGAQSAIRSTVSCPRPRGTDAGTQRAHRTAQGRRNGLRRRYTHRHHCR